MDELLVALQNVSEQLLPFLGVIVLIFLVLVLKKVLHILTDAQVTVSKVNTAMDKVNNSLDELKAPLSTLTRVSHSIDLVQTATESAVKSAVRIVADNFEWIKDSATSVVSKMKKDKKETGGNSDE